MLAQRGALLSRCGDNFLGSGFHLLRDVELICSLSKKCLDHCPKQGKHGILKGSIHCSAETHFIDLLHGPLEPNHLLIAGCQDRQFLHIEIERVALGQSGRIGEKVGTIRAAPAGPQ